MTDPCDGCNGIKVCFEGVEMCIPFPQTTVPVVLVYDPGAEGPGLGFVNAAALCPATIRAAPPIPPAKDEPPPASDPWPDGEGL